METNPGLTREETEEKLRLSEESLAAAIEASGAGVYEHNIPIDNEKIYVSPRWLELHGMEPDMVPPGTEARKWLGGFIHPDDMACFKETHQGLVNGAISNYEIPYRVKCPDGRWKSVVCLGRVVKSKRAGRKDKLVGVVLDLSQRKSVEKANLERARMEGAMEMAGAACHELNQPLQVLFGHAELLYRDVAAQPHITRRAEAILSELNRMVKIIKKIQGITKYETMDYVGSSKILDIRRSCGPNSDPF